MDGPIFPHKRLLKYFHEMNNDVLIWVSFFGKQNELDFAIQNELFVNTFSFFLVLFENRNLAYFLNSFFLSPTDYFYLSRTVLMLHLLRLEFRSTFFFVMT